MTMSVDKLFEAVNNTVVTKEMKDALVKRLAAADKRFEEADRKKHTFPQGFMDKEYTI